MVLPTLRVTVLFLAAATAGCVSARARPEPSDLRSTSQDEAALIRATERERLRALVGANVEAARALHADDFQLINPLGGSLSKDQYLDGVAAGVIDYLRWEPEMIDVRQYGHAAVIRYRSQLEIVVQGQLISIRPYWHTDLYEKRNGAWQVVWSHATEVK